MRLARAHHHPDPALDGWKGDVHRLAPRQVLGVRRRHPLASVESADGVQAVALLGLASLGRHFSGRGMEAAVGAGQHLTADGWPGEQEVRAADGMGLHGFVAHDQGDRRAANPQGGEGVHVARFQDARDARREAFRDRMLVVVFGVERRAGTKAGLGVECADGRQPAEHRGHDGEALQAPGVQGLALVRFQEGHAVQGDGVLARPRDIARCAVVIAESLDGALRLGTPPRPEDVQLARLHVDLQLEGRHGEKSLGAMGARLDQPLGAGHGCDSEDENGHDPADGHSRLPSDVIWPRTIGRPPGRYDSLGAVTKDSSVRARLRRSRPRTVSGRRSSSQV